MKRCGWVTNDEIYIKYHDEEWGKPKKDTNELFELFILEGFQAGLSWLTILKKRENFRKAFDDFDARKISNYSDQKVEELMQNEGIIRNRLKINATIKNAKLFLEMEKEKNGFSDYLWSFVKHQPILNSFKSLSEIPAKTEISELMSKNLKKIGFKFCGPTICYAFMQSSGMVNDHARDCFLFDKQLL